MLQEQFAVCKKLFSVSSEPACASAAGAEADPDNSSTGSQAGQSAARQMGGPAAELAQDTVQASQDVLEGTAGQPAVTTLKRVARGRASKTSTTACPPSQPGKSCLQLVLPQPEASPADASQSVAASAAALPADSARWAALLPANAVKLTIRQDQVSQALRRGSRGVTDTVRKRRTLCLEHIAINMYSLVVMYVG